MKEFSLPLKHKHERPIIELYRLPALIDTGAVVPVFSIFPTILEKVFDAKLILPNKFIGGFGGFGGLEWGSVYSLAEFKIGELVFENFEVFVPNEPRLKFPFLLSATLFHGTAYEFDTLNEKFTVRLRDDQPLKRDFKIKDLNGRLFPQLDGILFQDIDIELQAF